MSREGNKAGTTVDAVVRRMYGALSEDIDFELVLHHAGTLFRSSISSLHAEDFGTRRSRLTLVGDLDADEYEGVIGAYNARWSGLNLWMERSQHGLQTRGYQIGDAVVDERELRASTYYRHFLKPLDIRHGVGVRIWQGADLDMAVASFHRGHGACAFDAEDCRRIDAVRPHLANAYAIHRRVACLERQVDSLRAGFEHAPLGMLVLDGTGSLVECNDLAEEALFASGLARREGGGAWWLSHRPTQAALELALSAVAQADGLPSTLALRKADGCLARIALHLCRVPQGTLGGFERRACLLVFVAELDRRRPAHWAQGVIRSVLGLSRAEARVALALLEHGDIPAAAEHLGISAATARTHVKMIHLRLGVRRNSDVLMMLDRLLGPLHMPG